jgi:hypothetical protein
LHCRGVQHCSHTELRHKDIHLRFLPFLLSTLRVEQ